MSLSDREQAKWDAFVRAEYGEHDWLDEYERRIERWETTTRPRLLAVGRKVRHTAPKVWALMKGALR